MEGWTRSRGVAAESRTLAKLGGGGEEGSGVGPPWFDTHELGRQYVS
jgi:hypothetical protein